MDNLTPEEKQVRLKKADSIRRMLAEQSSVQSGHRNTGIVVYIYIYIYIYIAIAAKSFLKEGEKKDLLTFMWDFLLEFMVLEKSHPIKKVDKNPKK